MFFAKLLLKECRLTAAGMLELIFKIGILAGVVGEDFV